MAGLGLMTRRRAIQASPTQGDYIRFADAEVFRILMNKGISADGVGITYEDAARVTSITEDWFSGNTSITEFDELQYFINLKRIGNTSDASSTSTGFFYNCANLKSVTLPESLEIVGSYAFRNCRLMERVNLPKSLKTIGYRAFQNCSATMVLNAPNLATLIKQSGQGDSNSNAFTDSGLTEITNLGLLKTIPGGFDWESKKYSTFSYCKSLTKANIENITSVGSFAFEGCSALKEVTMGESLTSLKERAFYNCTGLEKVIIRAVNPPTLSSTALGNTNSCLIYVPDNSVATYKAASGWSSLATRIKPISEYQG